MNNDYAELYNRAQDELSELKQQKAVLESKIGSLVQELNLDPSKDLQSQVESLKESLEKEVKEMEDKLSQVLSELESLKSSADGTESFE